jgi:hypothetical protein
MQDANNLIRWRVESWTPTGAWKPTEVRVVAAYVDGGDFATIRFTDAAELLSFIAALKTSSDRVFAVGDPS